MTSNDSSSLQVLILMFYSMNSFLCASVFQITTPTGPVTAQRRGAKRDITTAAVSEVLLTSLLIRIMFSCVEVQISTSASAKVSRPSGKSSDMAEENVDITEKVLFS
jgi:hypothetical protein